MKNSIIKTAALMLLVAGSFACSKNEPPEPKSSEKAILSFTVDNLIEAQFDKHSGIQEETFHTINLIMPPEADVTSLVPTFTVSPGATVSPASGVPQDFSKVVEYIVTAEDGTASTYWVKAFPPFEEELITTRFVTTVIINSGFGGYTEPSGFVSYETMYPLSCRAYPYFGYKFIGWLVNDDYRGSEEYFHEYVPSNARIHAVFAETVEYTVVVESDDITAGSVSGGGTVMEGLSVSLSATPYSGYVFEGWYNGPRKISEYSNDSYIPTEDCIIIAKFRYVGPCTITLATENPNRGTVSGGGTVTPPNSVSISATPKPGFAFDGWYKSGTKVQGLGANATFVPTENTTLLARFNDIPSVISGPGVLFVGSSGTFSVTNTPIGFTWNKRSNLNLSGSGNSVTATATANGAGWVSMLANGTEKVRYNLWGGPPTDLAVSGLQVRNPEATFRSMPLPHRRCYR